MNRKCLSTAVILALAAGSARADFSYEQTSKITGGMMAGMMKFAGAFSKQAREPMRSTVTVKGDRMAMISANRINIIDLAAETMTDVDLEKKTYAVITFADFKLDNDAVVIATPEIAGLPYVVSGLVAAGGLAAALSTADGLLLAIANALSHDVYYRMIDTNAPTRRRLIVARILLLGVAIVGAYTASYRPANIVAMVAWAFSLAAGGLFPALVLGIWWKRTTSAGAIAGMAAGFGLTLLYLIVTRYFPEFGVNALGMTSLVNPVTGAPVIDIAAALADPATASAALASKVGWFNVNNISSALFGLPVGFAVMIVVSLMTPAPSKEMQEFIDEVRRPRGKTMMEEKTA